MEEEHEDHGHSVAAWTLVTIVLVGSVIGAIAVVVANGVLGIIAVIVALIGVVAGKVLAMAGYGAKGHTTHDATLAPDTHHQDPQVTETHPQDHEQSGSTTVGQS